MPNWCYSYSWLLRRVFTSLVISVVVKSHNPLINNRLFQFYNHRDHRERIIPPFLARTTRCRNEQGKNLGLILERKSTRKICQFVFKCDAPRLTPFNDPLHVTIPYSGSNSGRSVDLPIPFRIRQILVEVAQVTLFFAEVFATCEARLGASKAYVTLLKFKQITVLNY